MKTPEELLGLIDAKYFEAKKLGISRFDIRWGEWSALMNRALRTHIKDDPNDLRSRYVFVYWSICSQLLELHYKHKLFGRGKKRDLVDELKKVKEIILTGKGAEQMSDSDLIDILVGKGTIK